MGTKPPRPNRPTNDNPDVLYDEYLHSPYVQWGLQNMTVEQQLEGMARHAEDYRNCYMPPCNKYTPQRTPLLEYLEKEARKDKDRMEPQDKLILGLAVGFLLFLTAIGALMAWLMGN